MSLQLQPSKYLKILFVIFLFFNLCFSVYSYYTSLSQYATADQVQFAYTQTQKFLNDCNSIEVEHQYHVTYVTSIIGNLFDKLVKSNYSINDQIIGNIYYTSLWPFSFVHVSVALFLLFYAVFLIGKLLNLGLKKDFHMFLFIAVLLLNYPTLKGVVKVFTYDSLSISFLLIAILSYLLYVKKKRYKKLLLTAFFCSLACIEKVTSFSVVMLILLFELIHLSLQQHSGKKVIIDIFKFIGIFSGIFILTMFLLVPKFIINPSEFFNYCLIFFSWIFGFLDIIMIIIILFVVVIAWFLLRIISNNSLQIISFIKNKIAKKALIISFCIVVSLLISAWFYQKPSMIDMTTAKIETISKIKSSGYFVSSGTMAEVSISTMDTSAWITRIKILYDNVRLFCYYTPELILLLVLIAPLLLLYHRKKNILIEKKTVVILFLFPLAILSLYSFLITPVYPRYSLVIFLLFTVLGIFLLINTLRNIDSKKMYYGIIIIFSSIMLQPTFAADPVHFNYVNIIRNVDYENNDYLNMDNYLWTYYGWGETSEPCFKYISENTNLSTRVLYDYLIPFHFSKKIQPVFYAPIREKYIQFDNNDLKLWLEELLKMEVKYLQFSKNIAFRSSRVNFIMKNYKNKTVFIDKNCGIEYGWVFKTETLLSSITKKNNFTVKLKQ